MLASSDTSRPLPPAKARRATARSNPKMSSTPPPAYGSTTFTFPSRHENHRRDILGSPMNTTYRMMGWDGIQDHDTNASLPRPPQLEDMEWLTEKSREELQDLLFRADGIIKERENELGLTSVACKSLYENNVALKSKHEALLARIPMSPARSTSSPEHLSTLRSRVDSMSLSYSTSESALVKPQGYTGHTRKISIASADISLLADQNAELLDKLQQLEEEATTTDQAGRRELKRLEKEISFLREALEKTQAKSEELEEKVQGAVVAEAARRKKEREAKFKGMRDLARDDNRDGEIRDFAPGGSRFGGPTEAFSFFPAAGSPDGSRLPLSASSTTSDVDLNVFEALGGFPQHALICQLLTKVHELEDANTRILQQQADTANQLSAVQRDTMQITKVYECLADPAEVELQLIDGEESPTEERHRIVSQDGTSPQTIRFRSLKRNIERDFSLNGTSIVHPSLFPASGKNRKTVMGLFDEQEERPPFDDGRPAEDTVMTDRSFSSWSEGHARSWSSFSNDASLSPTRPRSLSPLHFFSPPSRTSSDMPVGLTLQNELNMKLGDGDWGMEGQPNHLRTSSLYDISQISVPSTPTPISRVMSRRASDELDYDAMRKTMCLTPNAMSNNPLRLSVEPPTPDNSADMEDCDVSGARSPRMQMMAETLRGRSDRWTERRLQRSLSRDRLRPNGHAATVRPKSLQRTISAGIPKRLSNVVDSMIEALETLSSTSSPGEHVEDAPKSATSSNRRSHRSSTPEPRDRNALQLHVGASPPKKKDEASLQNFGLQVWMWLQFILVILVFLFAMAKKGPTAVLVAEGDRKAVARRG